MRSNQRDHGNDSSGDDEREGQIRVGKEYQINPPEFIPLESKYSTRLLTANLLFFNNFSVKKNYLKKSLKYICACLFFQDVELTNVQNVPFWCGLPVQQFQTRNVSIYKQMTHCRK